VQEACVLGTQLELDGGHPKLDLAQVLNKSMPTAVLGGLFFVNFDHTFCQKKENSILLVLFLFFESAEFDWIISFLYLVK
jgi:hypothetical protein